MAPYTAYVFTPAELRVVNDRIDNTKHNIQSGDWARMEVPGGIKGFWDHLTALQNIHSSGQCPHPMSYRQPKYDKGMECTLCKQPLYRVK